MNFVYMFSCIGSYCICTVSVCFLFLFYCTCTTFVVNKRKHIINPPGIALPKGLYFTVVVFSFLLSVFFFRRLISEVSERILTKLGQRQSPNFVCR